MQIYLSNFPYRYMEYEKELQLREIHLLFPNSTIINSDKNGILLEIDETLIKNAYELTFTSCYRVNTKMYFTRQALLENDDTLKTKKQHTRYSTHGIHEYKGKFNPQIVHCLLNLFNIKPGNILLDPFNGSGTTILECAHANINAYGTDINPLACFIANTKVQALSIDINEAKQCLDSIIKRTLKPLKIEVNNLRMNYLTSWIPNNILQILETIRVETAQYPDALKNLFLLIASDLIRDYSLQEPSDLRIRRRISPMPDRPFLDLFSENALKYIRKIEEIQSLDISIEHLNKAFLCDIRKDNPFGDKIFDAAITSPPYVTALPYIDTQRISLVWLDLCEASEITSLETTLIGSREMLHGEKLNWTLNLDNNTYNLPSEIYNLVITMSKSIEEKDGFRKRAVPALVYRYFVGMKEMFINTFPMIKADGKYALIVGHNHTTLGGKEFNIDTPQLLGILAESCGWLIEEILPLQTYKRYGINSKNAINKESLIILKK